MIDRPIRFDIERLVEFRVADAKGATPHQGRTINISSSGVLFHTDQQLAVGRKLEMVVHMTQTSPDGVDVNLYLLGTVVRSGPGWAAARVRKHQILPTNPPGTRPSKDTGRGTAGGP
ncbi:MAG TPA: PilZ domain-containing protein [Bryobacterales bacterium]|jgi:hypothetical protein|nr:PilZ domain-containing protein [Bryobacterales bacterium]